ncbi:TPA: hypothetical protein R8G77_000383 [Citrobacter freundii]|nr:hypothetical protein [Citrobacter freundii]
MAYGIQVWRKGVLVNAFINPTNVIDVITSGSGSKSYTPLTGWALEVCATGILINGQSAQSTASVSGWTVNYTNATTLRPIIVTIRGV